MEIFSNLYLLIRRLVLCCVVMLSVNTAPSYAWSFSSAELPCTVPAGLYKARQLGAGFDALDIAVSSSGEVQGCYRLSTGTNVHQSPTLYEAWLDSKSSYITCQGNTIDISTSDSGHTLDLSLVWNRSLMELQVAGSYVGGPSWTRWGIKHGLELTTVVALIYSSVYVYRHQDDFRLAFEVLRGVHHVNQNWTGIIGATLAGWANQGAEFLMRSYFLDTHLYDFTLPAIGGLTGMVTTPFISNYSTYPLNGSGRQSSAGQKEETCTIPQGVYFGEVIDPSQGSFTITIPVSESESKDQSGRVSASSGETTTYDIEPSKFVCQGNEIILKWDKSLPASKGAMSAFYDEERGLLMGTGHFARSGWVSYSNPIPLPSVQFIREKQW